MNNMEKEEKLINVNANEMIYSFLECKNCVFNEGCEKIFSSCPANFISDKADDPENELEYMHLKYLEKDNWDKLPKSIQESLVSVLLDEYECNDEAEETNSEDKE